MRTRHLYMVLAVVGTIVPCVELVRFILENGLNLGIMVEQLFATHAGGFFALDVLVSTLVLWAFLAVERRRRRIRHVWAAVVGSLLVGVSLGLPLALYLREVAVEARSGTS